MSRFKDLSPQWITKLISPKYQQVSLGHMLADHGFTGKLVRRHKAVAITTSARQYHGSIEFIDGRYTLHLPEGTQLLRNDQHLVVLFGMKEKSFYFQARSVHVYPRKIELGAIPARFYERKKVSCPVTLACLSTKHIEQMTSGEIIVRRFNAEDQESSKIFYLSRDAAITGTGEAAAITFEPNDIRMATMRDLSQGGCSLVLGPLPEQLKIPQVIQLQMILKIGETANAISCFAAIKETIKHGDHLQVRCEFFDPLPTLRADVTDGTSNYLLRFGEKVQAIVNNESSKPSESLDIALPFGNNVALVTWPDETETTIWFTVDGQTGREIDLRRNKEKKEKIEAA